MTKRVLMTFGLALLLSVNLQVHAVDNIAACESQSSNKNMFAQCLDRTVNKLNNELQTWVNNHNYNLQTLIEKTGRRAAAATFKRAQEQFIQYRESNCRWYFLMKTPHPDASTEYQKCYIKLTQIRIYELAQVNSETIIDDRLIK